MLWNAVIVSEMPLYLVPEILDPVDVVDVHVVKFRDIQYIIGAETVGVND